MRAQEIEGRVVAGMSNAPGHGTDSVSRRGGGGRRSRPPPYRRRQWPGRGQPVPGQRQARLPVPHCLLQPSSAVIADSTRRIQAGHAVSVAGSTATPANSPISCPSARTYNFTIPSMRLNLLQAPRRAITTTSCAIRTRSGYSVAWRSLCQGALRQQCRCCSAGSRSTRPGTWTISFASTTSSTRA